MSSTPRLRLARRPSYICHSCRALISSTRIASKSDHGDQRRWISRNHIRKIQTAEAEWAQRAEEIQKGTKKSILDFLDERGYVNQIVGTREDLNKLLIHRRVGIYAGIDPTAPSMHVGHMVPFMALGWLYVHGYGVHFVLGGFTATIGDPTGRLTEREGQGTSTQKANVASMHMQLKKFGVTLEKYAERRGYMKEWAWKRALVNNTAWWTKTTVWDFMRLCGRRVRIGPMLGRDTYAVKNRMEKGDGMSFAEFSYPLIQAWDWYELYKKGVQVQVGGADQFGNILAGAEAVKAMVKFDPAVQHQLQQGAEIEQHMAISVTNDPLGFTVPLLTTASGEKFGKSAGNAVWLDPEMTSSYDLYQFFLRSADADVEKYLKLFTFLPLSEIQNIMAEHRLDESGRIAQHKLAKEFVELAHGLAAAEEAEAQHRQFHRKNLSLRELKAAAQRPKMDPKTGKPEDLHPSLNKHAQPFRMEDQSSMRISLPRSLVIGQPLSRILWSAGLVASRSEGQRLVNNGGVYIGARSDAKGGMDDAVSYTPARDSKWESLSKYVIDEELLILRVGKWKIKIISIVPDDKYEETGLSCPGWKVDEEESGGTESPKQKPARIPV